MVNWYSILVTVLFAIAGFFIEYFKTKQAVTAKAAEMINQAETVYKDVAKAGGKKMRYVCVQLHNLVPGPLKPFITEELIESMVQAVFDKIEDYAKKQLDKVVDKIVPEEE